MDFVLFCWILSLAINATFTLVLPTWDKVAAARRKQVPAVSPRQTLSVQKPAKAA